MTAAPRQSGLYLTSNGAAFIDYECPETRWIENMAADQEAELEAAIAEQERTAGILRDLGADDPPDEDFIEIPGLVRQWGYDMNEVPHGTRRPSACGEE